MNTAILDYLKTWKPNGNRVLVLPKSQEETLGIIKSDTGQGDDKRIVGEIIAVGKGGYEDGKLVPVPFGCGDKVIFGRYAGDDLLINEDLTIEKYDGICRDDQVFVTILRADSLLSII